MPKPRVGNLAVKLPNFTLAIAAPSTPQPITVASTAVPTSKPSLARLGTVRFIDPALAARLVGVRAPTQGRPREEMTVPICPATDVSDAVLFEDPKNAATKYFLPRYKLATDRTTGGGEQYRIGIEERPPGWSLRLHLGKYPAKEIEPAAREASELPHQVAVILRYLLTGSGGVQKELTFGDVTVENDGLQAAVQLNSMTERDEVYHALTRAESNAVLVLRRAIRVAIPVFMPPVPAQPSTVPTPVPTQPSAVPTSVPTQPLPTLRTPMLRPFIVATVPPRGGALRRIPPDLGSETVTPPAQPLTTAPAQPQQYREVTRALDNAIAPFFFPLDLHRYIYGGIAPAGPRPGLILHQHFWSNRFHSFYQETSRRYLFYYLPDAFKVARRPESPHLPFVSVDFASDDGSLDAMQATLAYAAAPYVDPDRLEAATQELKSVTGSLPEGVDGPVFQPLLADAKRITFRLALPGAPGLHQRRPDALVNLQLGIVDSLTLSLQELQPVFDALMGSGTAVFMTGEIEVSLGDDGGLVAEKVPFTGRLSDLAGEIFDHHQSPDPETGGLQVKLRNAIESPVRIDRLPVVLRRGESEVTGELRGLAIPVERLSPAEELTFTVIPTGPLPGAGQVEAAFDLDGVTVLPDREAIWTAIQDPFTAQYRQTITVKTLPAIFEPPQGQPSAERLVEIDVELKRGEDRSVSVALTPEKPEVQVSLPFPISDVILRRENSGEYRYKVTTIRLSRATEKGWKTKTGDRLFILQDDVI